MLSGKIAGNHSVVLVFDTGALGPFEDAVAVEGLRKTETLIVVGWANSALAKVADVVLPITTHAETEGTFINSQNRLQKFERAFPAPAGVVSGVRVLSDVVRRFRSGFRLDAAAGVFALMGDSIPALHGIGFEGLPADGLQLPVRLE